MSNLRTPDWVKSACFYQIFPDRFAKTNILDLNFETWDSEATPHGFKGGNLYGVIEKIPYLLELGINAIYFTPIFSSTANHRYHTYDYFNVDPILGGNKALKSLIEILHKNNIKIILDGVFNHASRGFYQFNHTLENGKLSPYIDWFNFNLEFLDKNKTLKAYEEGLASKDAFNDFGYDAWFNLPSLPKFNTDNKDVRNFLFSVAKYWVDFGIDGWRLDVPNEIDDDSFWQEFRRLVKKANPNAYIVGEIWDEAKRWLKGDQFDAVMNYNLGKNIISYFINESINFDTLIGSDYAKGLNPKINSKDFVEKVLNTFSIYNWSITISQMNLMTSHDTARILSIASEKVELVKLAFAFMFFCPGAPCIFYGDEIGLKGKHDPDCRKAFNWDKSLWDQDLLKFFKELIQIRLKHKVLHDGTMRCLNFNENASIWLRETEAEYFIFGINRASSKQTIEAVYKNKTFTFDLEPYSYKWQSSLY